MLKALSGLISSVYLYNKYCLGLPQKFDPGLSESVG